MQSKQVGQRNERLKSLFHEAEHLRKQLKEAIAARNSALCQVRESERLFEKLEAMEPLIVKAGILNEQDLACNCDDFAADKGLKPVDAKRRAKDGSNVEGSGVTKFDEIQADFVRFPRKQAFKKWALILSKIRSALLVFVSKVHATSQLESSLKMEKDSFNSLIQRLQREVLSELDSKNLDSMVEMERLRGEEQIDLAQDIENHTRSVKVDRELIHKILTAVRAQKRRLQVATGRIEDLKKEKISSESNLFNKQKRISELVKKLDVVESNRDNLLPHISCLHSMLVHIDDSSVTGEESENTLAVSNALNLNCGVLNSLATQLPEAADIETVVRKVRSILDEREETKAKISGAQRENVMLRKELASLHDGLTLFGVSDDEMIAGSENLGLNLKQYKARKDELESLYEESVTLHQAITRNLLILQGILTEGMVYDEKLLRLDYTAMSKAADKSLLQDSFKQVVSCLPDMVLKVNLLSTDQKEFDLKLRKAEQERKEAESEVVKQLQRRDASAALQKELDEAKNVLKEIYSCVSSESIETSSIGPTTTTILEKIHGMIAHMQDISKENAECKHTIEGLSREVLSAQEVSLDVLRLVNSLRQDLSEGDAPENLKSETGAGSTQLETEKHEDFSSTEHVKWKKGNSEFSLSALLYQLKTRLEEVQSLRKMEKMRIANRASGLKQELEKSNEQLEKHVKYSVNASSDYIEKMQALSEEIASIKAERESLLAQVSASSAQISELEHSVQDLQHQGNAQMAALQSEKEGLNAELKKVNMQSQEQSLLFDQSRMDLINTVEALRLQLSDLKAERSGSKDSVEELRRMMSEGKSAHERASKEWEVKRQSLEKEFKQLEQEMNQSVMELETLNMKLRERELTIESMTKAELQQAESFKMELAKASHEQAGSGSEISKLQALLKEREIAASEAGSQLSEYSKRFETLSKESTNLQSERVRLEKQIMQLQQELNDNDTMYKSKLKYLSAEVYRLGGPDIADDNEKSRLQTAAERVKDYLSRGVLSDTLLKSEKGKDAMLNPLRKLAVFQVDLLVNTKAHKQLEVSGSNGGLTQAAVHYFTISQQSGEITFGNGNAPGSQSSNMLAELMLLSANDTPIYETKAGDILGLSVKVKGLNDKNTREILYNTSVIRTDEVMEAIKGQPIDNFSLWPDLVSSWKWERSATKGWVLVCIKWRFLFKNIFPEISEPLQVLSIKQGT